MLSWHFDVSLEFMMWAEAEAYCGIEVDVSLQGTRQLQTMLAMKATSSTRQQQYTSR